MLISHSKQFSFLLWITLHVSFPNFVFFLNLALLSNVVVTFRVFFFDRQCSVLYLFYCMTVFRWRWCGDSRGGCRACRAWHQWVVHWYVWKDGHLPARRTHRSLNTLHSALPFLQTGRATVDSRQTDRQSNFWRLFFVSHHSVPFIPSGFFSVLHILCISSATCEDYRLLENMNKLTSLKYMEMKDISINISRNLQDLNNKCEWDALYLTAQKLRKGASLCIIILFMQFYFLNV